MKYTVVVKEAMGEFTWIPKELEECDNITENLNAIIGHWDSEGTTWSKLASNSRGAKKIISYVVWSPTSHAIVHYIPTSEFYN